MNSRWKGVLAVSLGVLVLGMSACTGKGSGVTRETMPLAIGPRAVAPQTTCPVMGGAINKTLYTDHDGKRIYVCCPGCVDVIKKNPAKYIQQLEAKGITLDKAPGVLCPKCGVIKGSAKCCKLEGRTKNPRCGLLKGSPGCCKLPK